MQPMQSFLKYNKKYALDYFDYFITIYMKLHEGNWLTQFKQIHSSVAHVGEMDIIQLFLRVTFVLHFTSAQITATLFVPLYIHQRLKVLIQQCVKEMYREILCKS